MSSPQPLPPEAITDAITDAEAATAWLVAEAQALGLSRLACGPATEVSDYARFTAWLAADLAGELGYLRKDGESRADPRALLASARSIVSVAVSYAHPDPPINSSGGDSDGLRGQIARYARAEDYHLVLKRRLNQLGERIVSRFGKSVGYRVCVDSAPLLERALGARAGLGFVGKNSLLITPGVGSYTVLGELLTDLELSPGTAQGPRCGSCRLCLDVCPTGAIVDEYRIDAGRCISYLTIENSGAIPRSLRRAVGGWIFGCDLCQEVCPFNASDRRSGDPEFAPRGQQSRPSLLWLLGLGAAQFRRFVKRTALRRIGRSQLLRNVAVALGNLGSAQEVPALAQALEREPPLVRQHLVWALGEIAARDPSAASAVAEILDRQRLRESDEAVREELALLLTAAAR